MYMFIHVSTDLLSPSPLILVRAGKDERIQAYCPPFTKGKNFFHELLYATQSVRCCPENQDNFHKVPWIIIMCKQPFKKNNQMFSMLKPPSSCFY
jgi:hypothetical protein